MWAANVVSPKPLMMIPYQSAVDIWFCVQFSTAPNSFSLQVSFVNSILLVSPQKMDFKSDPDLKGKMRLKSKSNPVEGSEFPFRPPH